MHVAPSGDEQQNVFRRRASEIAHWLVSMRTAFLKMNFNSYRTILPYRGSTRRTGRMDSVLTVALCASQNFTVNGVCVSLIYHHGFFLSSGNSTQILLNGKATVTFLDKGEEYTLNYPYVNCKGAYHLFV